MEKQQFVVINVLISGKSQVLNCPKATKSTYQQHL